MSAESEDPKESKSQFSTEAKQRILAELTKPTEAQLDERRRQETERIADERASRAVRLYALEQALVTKQGRKVSKSKPNARRERGPDFETSRERVTLEDTLRAELGSVKSQIEKGTGTLKQMEERFPNFQLWKILSSKEQEELLTEEFRPRTYARTLVTRKFGLTSTETIKKDRQKLRGRRP